MNEFIENLRKQCGNTEETSETTNLILNKQQFVDKIVVEKDGLALLDLLERGEWRVAERLGLIRGYQQDDQVYFQIPRWNNFVQHLKIVHSV